LLQFWRKQVLQTILAKCQHEKDAQRTKSICQNEINALRNENVSKSRELQSLKEK
jgi:hypothetical protein